MVAGLVTRDRVENIEQPIDLAKEADFRIPYALLKIYINSVGNVRRPSSRQ